MWCDLEVGQKIPFLYTHTFPSPALRQLVFPLPAMVGTVGPEWLRWERIGVSYLRSMYLCYA